MGGFHLGTVANQAEVNNMVAKAIDNGSFTEASAKKSLASLSRASETTSSS
jgi:hypothetical protein